MLSFFPTLLSYNLLVPLVFRIVSGLLFISFGYESIYKNREAKIAVLENFRLKPGKVWLGILALIEIVGGAMLVIGLYAQLASLILSVLIVLGMIAKNKNSANLHLSFLFLFLFLLITLSLMFLGAGSYAIDLPL